MVDYVIVGVIAISALIGLVRGFVREVLSLAIWALAVMLALAFADELAAMLPKRIEGASLRFVTCVCDCLRRRRWSRALSFNG